MDIEAELDEFLNAECSTRTRASRCKLWEGALNAAFPDEPAQRLKWLYTIEADAKRPCEVSSDVRARKKANHASAREALLTAVLEKLSAQAGLRLKDGWKSAITPQLCDDFLAWKVE